MLIQDSPLTFGRSGRLARSSARSWTLALLQGTSALGLAAVAAAPFGGAAPASLCAACAGVLGAMAVALLVLGDRIGRSVSLAFAGVRIAVAVVVIATAHSAGATFFAGAGFVWVALWVTGFFNRRLLALTLVSELAGLAVAAAVNGQHLRTAVDGATMVGGAIVLSVLLAQALGSLRQEARHDHLTGLMNRYGVDEALRKLSERPRQRETASLVAFDLDGLKAVNDRGGHVAGDRMLVTFATELSAAVGADDLPARVGGDEFIAILPGFSAEAATLWARQLRQRSCIPWSFGVAERRVEEPLEHWLGRADQRMYAAKSAGRDQLLAAVAGA